MPVDAESKRAALVLEAIATCSERLIGPARTLRSHPRVVRVDTDFTPRRYVDGPAFDGYVDAQLQSGDSVVWSLDIRQDEERWTIWYRVKLIYGSVDAEGMLREWDDRTAETIDPLC